MNFRTKLRTTSKIHFHDKDKSQCNAMHIPCPLPPYPTKYEAASYPSSGNVRCCTGMVAASKRRHNPQEHSGIVI